MNPKSFHRWKRRNARALLLFVAWTIAAAPTITGATNPLSNPTNGMILRVRLGDGSMQRIQVKEGSQDTTTLSKILAPWSQDDDESATVQVGTTTIEDTSQTLSTLGLQHGSLITITPPRRDTQTTTSRFQITKSNRFDPFPDLARDYQTAVRRKAQRGTTGRMSYGDLAHVQSALHVVEPQPKGPLERVYMCRVSAERFSSNCLHKNKQTCRVGLLFGTMQRERVDLKPVKARTSLSSTTSDQDYCQVAKVQALWEPAPQVASSNHYDATSLITDDTNAERALTVADWLGLTLVGWIFSYTDSRSDDDSLPVWARDVHVGASQIIAKMKRCDNRDEGQKFATLAMDANSGATEAFQLSDVSVQMVAEKMWSPDQGATRKVTTHHPIIVDGQETTVLDSVLCLVNTAMLSHVGSYAGKTTNSVNRKNGTLTAKTKKALLAALDTTDDASLLNALSDFNILVVLDAMLPAEQTHELCRLVKKWVRGQKHGTTVPKTLKVSLQSVLSS